MTSPPTYAEVQELLHVTLDTNVYTRVAAYISEGSLSLESLPRDERIDLFLREWVTKYPAQIELPHPPPIAVEELERMLAFDCCSVLHSPRIALVSFFKIPQDKWADDARHPIATRRKRHAGFASSFASLGLPQLRRLGKELVRVHALDTSGCGGLLEHSPPAELLWMKGIVAEFDDPKQHASSASFAKKVRDLIAEWFDIDIVASHYAYDLDYFCTCDRGRGSGPSSILHDWQDLNNGFDIKVVDPQELIALL